VLANKRRHIKKISKKCWGGTKKDRGGIIRGELEVKWVWGGQLIGVLKTLKGGD